MDLIKLRNCIIVFLYTRILVRETRNLLSFIETKKGMAK